MAEGTTTQRKPRKTKAQKEAEAAAAAAVDQALGDNPPASGDAPGSVVEIDLFALASELLELTPYEKALLEITASVPRLTVSIGAKVETLPYQNVNFSYTATVPVGLKPGTKAFDAFWALYDATAVAAKDHINQVHIGPSVDRIRAQFASQGVNKQ